MSDADPRHLAARQGRDGVPLRGRQWTAVAEERLSRVKLHAGFPKRAVADC